jgi:hypothetical protein
MSSEKLARRKKMGDDPTAMSMSNTTEAGAVAPPQPLPQAPQGKGNMMNNPMNGMSMGGGMPQPGSMQGMNLFPYGDGGIPSNDGRMGAVGYTANSGMPQNLVAGRGMNQQPYNTQQQPMGETQLRMNSLYMGQQSAERAQKLYAASAGGDPQAAMPSYQVGPMGMLGTPVEVNAQQPMPGAMPPGMDTRTQGELGLQGMQDAQMAAGVAMGLDTNRGGGRNSMA